LQSDHQDNGDHCGQKKADAQFNAVQQALDQCEGLRISGDYRRAIAVLNNALDRSPGNARTEQFFFAK
jgi:hypothetical protein